MLGRTPDLPPTSAHSLNNWTKKLVLPECYFVLIMNSLGINLGRCKVGGPSRSQGRAPVTNSAGNAARPRPDIEISPSTTPAIKIEHSKD